MAQLVAKLIADTKPFVSGLNRAKASMVKFGQLAKRAGQIAATGIAAATAALFALAIRQAGVIDATAKLANSLNVNIREFQAMAMVAGEAGVSQDNLGKAITRTQQAIKGAEDGLSTYTRAFDTLGLSSKELINLSPDQQFEKIAKALGDIENPTVRVSTAMEVFGKQGRDIINMLVGYGQRVDEAREFNDKFNISLNKIDDAKVEEANDAFGRLGMAVSGLGNTLAIEFAPIITAVSNYLLQAGVDGKSFGNAVKSGMEVAGVAVDILRHAILGMRLAFTAVIGTVMSEMARATGALITFGEAVSGVAGLVGIDLSVRQGLVSLNNDLIGGARETREEYNAIIKEMQTFESTADKIARAQDQANQRAEESVEGSLKRNADLNGILNQQSEAYDGVAKATKTASKEQRELERRAKEAAKAAADGAREAQRAIEELGNKAQAVFAGIFDALLGGSKFSGLAAPLADIFGGLALDFFPRPAVASFATGSKYIGRDQMAKVHRGEMIVPANQVGGGGVNINIQNNAGAEIKATASESNGNINIEMMVDEAVAKNINSTSSQTSRALSARDSRSYIRR